MSSVIELLKTSYDSYEEKPKVITIDNIQFAIGYGKGKDARLSQLIGQLVDFCNHRKCSIFVVAHARKTRSDKPIGLEDIMGSAILAQEAANVMCLQRYEERIKKKKIKRCYLEIFKNREMGLLECVKLSYDKIGPSDAQGMQPAGFFNLKKPNKSKPANAAEVLKAKNQLLETQVAEKDEIIGQLMEKVKSSSLDQKKQ